jgi:hypothetical protein
MTLVFAMRNPASAFAFTAALLLGATDASSQGVPIGAELRGYPAGGILAIRSDWPISERLVLGGSAGYNLTDRGDFGEHDDEEGGGPGVGVTLTRVRGPDQRGWQFGVRAELYLLRLDWREGTTQGETRVWVFQPTARVAYAWAISPSLRLEASASAGLEWNVRTRGEPVGEGAIVLLGIALLGRL